VKQVPRGFIITIIITTFSSSPGSLMHIPPTAAPEQVSGKYLSFCSWLPFYTHHDVGGKKKKRQTKWDDGKSPHHLFRIPSLLPSNQLL